MLESPAIVVLLLIALCLLSFVAPPLLAARKGYAWYLWIISCGIIGLVILAFLPDVSDAQATHAAKASRRRAGNLVGGSLSLLAIAGILFQLVVMLLGMSVVPRGPDPDINVIRLREYMVNLAMQSPLLLLLLLAGVAVAAHFRSRCPRASLLVFLGLALLAWNMFAMTAAFQWLPSLLMQASRNPSEMQHRVIYRSIAVIRNVMECAGIGLILAAAFVGRSRAAKPEEPIFL